MRMLSITELGNVGGGQRDNSSLYVWMGQRSFQYQNPQFGDTNSQDSFDIISMGDGTFQFYATANGYFDLNHNGVQDNGEQTITADHIAGDIDSTAAGQSHGSHPVPSFHNNSLTQQNVLDWWTTTGLSS